MKKRRSGRPRSPRKATKPQLRNPADQIILDHSDQILKGSALLILLNGTALAPALLASCPHLRWIIHTFDHLFVRSVSDALLESSKIPDTTPIDVFCTPDLPEKEVQTVVISTDSRGSGELLRDLVQESLARTTQGGRLVVSTNNTRDHWLHEHLRSVCGKVTVLKGDRGICYIARKPERAARVRQYTAEFAFRDQERLVACVSRPGVFSHRRVDGGARGLVRSLEHVSNPPNSVVEMGCGSGAAATAVALRFPNADVLAVDSHARAVHSTELTAKANEVTNLSVQLTSDGVIPDSGTYDLFLCNPPYYSDYRISELFLQSAAHSLRAGGRLHLVTKLTEWHENRMSEQHGARSSRRRPASPKGHTTRLAHCLPQKYM